MKKINKTKKNGFSLVEVIIAVGIFSILAVGVVFVATNSYTNFYGTGDRQTVATFAKEGMEAARAIRDNCWQDVEDAVSVASGVSKNTSGVWQFDASTDSQGSLTRTIAVSSVQRNEAGDIVASGGTEDPNTKKVTVTVSGPGIQDYSLTSFLTNWSQKEWCQKDWSGGNAAEFWQGANMIYASNKIDVANSNQLTLTAAAGGGEQWADWENLTVDASAYLTPFNMPAAHVAFSTNGNTAYVTGNNSTPKQKPWFYAYDVSAAREGTITQSWTLTLSNFNQGTAPYIVVHPNGNYAYVSNPTHSTTGTVYSIAIVNLNTHAATYHAGVSGKAFKDAVLVMDDSADYLYALDGYGRIYVYDISADGSSLTTVNTGQQMLYDTSGTWRFQDAWYDDASDKIYAAASNYNTGTYYDLMKINVTNKASLTVDYGYMESGSGNFRGITYAGTSGGHNRFLVLSSLSDQEFKTFEDNGTGFTQLDYLNPSIGYTFIGVIYDGDHTSLILSTDGKLLSIDVADLANISEVLTYNVASAVTLPTYPIQKIFHNATMGGVFYLSVIAEMTTDYYLNFIERPQGAGGGGGYESSGYATSSIFDIGSSDQQLSQVSIEQNVPSGCTLDIILQGSDTANFASYESQTFSNAASAYTGVTNANLNNKRFLRYVVYMAPCTVSTANDTTATLYSFKLKYR